MDASAGSDPLTYYPAVAATLSKYRALGPVVAGGWASDEPLGSRDDALASAVDAGAQWFCWGAGESVPGCIRAVAGPGADLATCATAMLAIIEDLAAAGTVLVPAVESAASLLLYLRPAEHLLGLSAALALRAPEMATLDPEDADGRALLTELGPGAPIPLPHSLVDGADGTTAVTPLTVDEIAALAAGMPIDPLPRVALERLRAEGDLAASLLSDPAAPRG